MSEQVRGGLPREPGPGRPAEPIFRPDFFGSLLSERDPNPQVESPGRLTKNGKRIEKKKVISAAD